MLYLLYNSSLLECVELWNGKIFMKFWMVITPSSPRKREYAAPKYQ
jgi:hypothetical protein